MTVIRLIFSDATVDVEGARYAPEGYLSLDCTAVHL